MQAEASALKALQIPDIHVRLPAQADGVTPALVVSSNGGAEYCITDPGTPDASCNCSWAKRGNHYKHLMKVSSLHSVVNAQASISAPNTTK